MTSPSPTGPPGYSETFPAEEASARRARLLVTAALNTWGIGGLVDVAVLVVDELVVNVIRHTSCRLLRVRVTRAGDRLVRISVTDKSGVVPDMGARADDDSEHGRGLVLVDALSQRWGYDLHRWGKTVWAALEVKP